VKIFDKLRPKRSVASIEESDDEAVLIYIDGEDFEQMGFLSDRLMQSLKETPLGIFDGNEIGGGETVFFLYGSDAESLFTHISPVLKKFAFSSKAKAIIRKGGPGAPQREVFL
jgi:hypothetical protein